MEGGRGRGRDTPHSSRRTTRSSRRTTRSSRRTTRSSRRTHTHTHTPHTQHTPHTHTPHTPHTPHSSRRTTHSSRRTTHSSRRTTHSSRRKIDDLGQLACELALVELAQVEHPQLSWSAGGKRRESVPKTIFFPVRGGDSNLKVSQTQGRRRTKMTHS